MFKDDDMEVKDWLLFMLLMAIPLFNIFFFLHVIFSENTNKCLKSYALATTIVIVIVAMYYLIFIME